MPGYYCIKSFEIRLSFTSFIRIDEDVKEPREYEDNFRRGEVEKLRDGIYVLKQYLKHPIVEYTCVRKDIVDKIYNAKYKGKCKRKQSCVEDIIYNILHELNKGDE